MTSTDRTRQDDGLTVSQRNAIDLLVQGRNDRETAEGVGVARQTICEWRHRHPAFIAALNRRREDVWGAQTQRLRVLVAQAVDVLEHALEGDDALKAAVHVLKAVGLYGTELQPHGELSAEEVEQQQIRAERNRRDREECDRVDRAVRDQERLLMGALAGL